LSDSLNFGDLPICKCQLRQACTIFQPGFQFYWLVVDDLTSLIRLQMRAHCLLKRKMIRESGDLAQ
jgi:hypothetical protein